MDSYLDISRSARAILRGILGVTEESQPSDSGPRFTGGTVSLESICEALQLDPSKCRKHLRRLVEKPGGRWEWSSEGAEKITSLLKECFVK